LVLCYFAILQDLEYDTRITKFFMGPKVQ